MYDAMLCMMLCYGDATVLEFVFVERALNETTSIICEFNGSYHRSCYKEF